MTWDKSARKAPIAFEDALSLVHLFLGPVLASEVGGLRWQPLQRAWAAETPAPGAASTFTASPASAVVGQPVALAAHAVDEFGFPLIGAPVSFPCDDGVHVVTADLAGDASTTCTSTVASTATFTASVRGSQQLLQRPTVRFDAGATVPAKSLVSASGPRPGGGGYSIVVTAADEYGNRTHDATARDVELHATLGSFGATTSPEPGSWTADLHRDGADGTAHVTATVDGVPVAQELDVRLDGVAPTFDAQPADVSVQTTSSIGAVVTFATPAVSDAVDASPSVGCTPASGSTFAIGTTTVTCTASDASGNEARASFTVTVRHVEPPTDPAPKDPNPPPKRATDTRRPTVTLAAPTCDRDLSAKACAAWRASARAWRTITGTVADRGDGASGIARVEIVVYGKVGRRWQAGLGSRLVARRSRAQSLATVNVAVVRRGTWRYAAPLLPRGSWTIRQRAIDRAGNASAWASRTVRIR